MSDRSPIRRALVSVYDKTGLEELARGLHAAGVEIVSTGSTARRIADAGVPVTPVEQLTGFPECLDGRVKTLHPRVHAGMLADRRKPEHVAQLEELGIAPFDLVVVNLYPFTETVASGASPDECVEQIDIGGPAMVRAAAKNHPTVAVVVDPARYDDVLAAGRVPAGSRSPSGSGWPTEAFRHTATYDIAVASWMGSVAGARRRTPSSRPGSAPAGSAPTCCATARTRTRAPRCTRGFMPPGLAHAEQLHGKEMSYNNYVDTDAALAGRARPRRPLRRDHQARQPVRHRRRHRRRRRAPQGARLRPGLGVRRRDRGQPRGRPRRWPSRWPRCSPRSSSRRRSPTTPSPC